MCLLYSLTKYPDLLFILSSIRRHTSFSRDWSSDVCSSDLPQQEVKPKKEDKEDLKPKEEQKQEIKAEPAADMNKQTEEIKPPVKEEQKPAVAEQPHQ